MAKRALAHLYDWKAEAFLESGRTVKAACGHEVKPVKKPFVKRTSKKYKAATRCAECERLSQRPQSEWKHNEKKS